MICSMGTPSFLASSCAVSAEIGLGRIGITSLIGYSKVSMFKYNMELEASVMKSIPQPVWNLDTIFPGGSASPSFRQFLDELATDMKHFNDQSSSWDASNPFAVGSATATMQSISSRLREADSFVACLGSQDMQDRLAPSLTGEVKSLRAAFESTVALYNRYLADIPTQAWESMLGGDAELQEIAFNLQERREEAKEMLSPQQEALIQDLAVDGYHGWSELYDTIVGRMRIETGGESLSVGQAANKLHDPDRAVRLQTFRAWEEAWQREEELCSSALNRIAGFRLRTYGQRGWSSVLKEPLLQNRMNEQTLQSMWQAIEEAKPIFVRYLERKAKLLGIERLSWYDVDAPISQVEHKVSYEEAAAAIIKQFSSFSPRMAAFAEQAFADRWIEAEDRAGKRPGGFCTSFPVTKQTRIFMTYGGTASNVSTLAHELGHAYHQYVMEDLPEMAQHYAMNVAETASTFAEWIIADAAVRAASDPKQRLALLEEKVQSSVSYFMNIHARFLFETQFYEERRKGLVSAERLCELMEEAQRQSYQQALGEYHPYFWASKLHFYLTDVPFYNYPYTFGYLFSTGLFALAGQQGPAFEDRYIALLRDTGRMTVEELAQKHLEVDLTKPHYWREAVAVTIKDVNQFLELTEA